MCFESVLNQVQEQREIPSFDKVVIKISLPAKEEVNNFLNKGFTRELISLNSEYWSQDDYKFYACNFKFEGIYLSWGFKGKNIDGFEQNHLRIEFNPNKTFLEELSIILKYIPRQLIRTIKYSRIDFAIDYEGYNLIPELFYHPRKRRGSYYFNNGQFETLYLGSHLSDLQFRIYNKRIEALFRNRLKLDQLTPEKIADLKIDYGLDFKKPVWRIETQMRKESIRRVIADNYQPLKDLVCVASLEDSESYDFKYRFFIQSVKNIGLQNSLKLIKEYKTRKGYIEFVKNYGKPLRHPQQIFEENFDKLFNDLDSRIRRMLRDSKVIPF